METIVGVTRGTDKFESFDELLNITNCMMGYIQHTR